MSVYNQYPIEDRIACVKPCAAVGLEAKKPLEIVELDHNGPRAGDLLIGIMATGISHTDVGESSRSVAVL